MSIDSEDENEFVYHLLLGEIRTNTTGEFSHVYVVAQLCFPLSWALANKPKVIFPAFFALSVRK